MVVFGSSEWQVIISGNLEAENITTRKIFIET